MFRTGKDGQATRSKAYSFPKGLLNIMDTIYLEQTAEFLKMHRVMAQSKTRAGETQGVSLFDALEQDVWWEDS